MSLGPSGADERTPSTQRYSQHELTPPMYQLTPPSPDPTTPQEEHSAIHTGNLSQASSITPLPPPTKLPLHIKWDTDSDSSASTSTNSEPIYHRRRLQIKWESSSESTYTSLQVPPTILIPSTTQTEVINNNEASSKQQHHTSQPTLHRFFTPTTSREPRTSPPEAASLPPSQQQPVGTSRPTRTWTHKRNTRRNKRHGAFLAQPTPTAQASTQNAQSRVQPSQVHNEKSTQDQPPAKTPTVHTHTNPYVRKRDQLLKAIPTPLANLQIIAPPSKSLSSSSDDALHSNDTSSYSASVSASSSPQTSYQIRTRSSRTQHARTTSTTTSNSSTTSNASTLSHQEINDIISTLSQDFE